MKHGKQLAREIFLDTLAALDLARVMELKLTLAGSILSLEDAAIDLSAFSSVVCRGDWKSGARHGGRPARLASGQLSIQGSCRGSHETANSHSRLAVFCCGPSQSKCRQLASRGDEPLAPARSRRTQRGFLSSFRRRLRSHRTAHRSRNEPGRSAIGESRAGYLRRAHRSDEHRAPPSLRREGRAPGAGRRARDKS